MRFSELEDIITRYRKWNSNFTVSDFVIMSNGDTLSNIPKNCGYLDIDKAAWTLSMGMFETYIILQLPNKVTKQYCKIYDEHNQ